MPDGKIMAVQTGIGRAGAGKAMDSICREPPEAILATGFCGALEEELSTGDLVCCSDFITPEGESSRRSVNGKVWKCLVEAGNGRTLTSGKGLTLPVVASNPSSKLELGKSFGAAICQMEDHWIAREANAHNIPFASVRVVFDELTDDLRDFEKILDDDGNIVFGKTLPYFIKNPHKLFVMVRIYKKYRTGSSSLSEFLQRLITNYEEVA